MTGTAKRKQIVEDRYMSNLLFGVLLVVVALAACAPSFAQQWTEAENQKGYVVFEHNTLENMPEDYVPTRQQISGKLSCALACGERSSVQLGVHSVADDLSNIRVTVTSDLPVTLYSRPATHPASVSGTPTAADLDKRVSSAYDWMYLQKGNVVAKLPRNASVNFWLTVHADADASPGMHSGKVRVEVDGKPATEVDMLVEVRPFLLAPARIPFGMYYARGQYYGADDALHSFIYRDMAEHSQNSVGFTCGRDAGGVDFSKVPFGDDHPFVKIIKTAKDAGLVSENIPCFMERPQFVNEFFEGRTPGLTKTQMKVAAAWLQAQQKERGWPELMVYGWDEPLVPTPGLRELYAPMRGVPIRLTTAMSMKAAYGYGDMHDVWIVHDGHFTPELRAEAKRRDAQVYTYSYRMWRQNFNPLTQRYYAGLHTWALNLGGNYVWEYYYDYNWIDPVSKQTNPTTGWEARRDGVDDYRYLQMLEEAIKAKPRNRAAVEASIWLETLRARVISEPNPDGYWNSIGLTASTSRVEAHSVVAGKPFGVEEFDRIAATAADYIVKISPAQAKPKKAPVTYVKDEAAAFRGKSVEQCVGGLRSPASATKRSAAWALWEVGPKAAAAVPELVKALDDPDVRIPALMAIQAIGPRAFQASGKVATLLSYPDDFIRLGASMTLAELAKPLWKTLAETPKEWLFRKDLGKIGESEKWFLPAYTKASPEWESLSTHAAWEEGYIGYGWYALDIVIPKTGSKRVWLQFGGVDENYTLWINGKYIADNMNAGTGQWNTPIQVDITDKFNQGESNHVVVRVHNTAYAGGIHKPVTLLVEE